MAATDEYHLVHLVNRCIYLAGGLVLYDRFLAGILTSVVGPLGTFYFNLHH